MTEKVKKPAIRFKGFTDAWEQRKLGDVGKAQSGIGFPDKEQGGNFGIPFYKVSDMNNEGNEHEMCNANNYVSEAQCKANGWTPITEISVVFAKVGAAIMLNRKRLVRISFLLDNNTMAYKFGAKWDIDFGKTLFEQVDLTDLVQIGALPSYNSTDVESVEISMPDKPEQHKIGVYFKQLDDLITLHQRKCDKLVNVKKSLLEKMFPADDEKVPKIRFKGFTETWEQRKLGDIVVEVTRNDPESNAPIMMITANNGFIEQSDRYAYDNAGNSLKKYILLEMGELAYNHGASKLRPYGSCFALTTAKSARIPFVYHCFAPKCQNSEFLSIELNGEEVEKQLRRIVSSGARMDGLLNISFNDYASVILSVPKIQEQSRISTCFRTIDNLITLHQRKLEKLKNIKKSLLEKMFV